MTNYINRTLRLKFDPSLPWGSKEHYFHALHGYLLPGLHHALAQGYRDIQFDDCGPLIQPRLYQGCALLGLNYVDPQASITTDVYQVPRWDRYLLHFESPPPSQSLIDAYRQMATPLVQQMQSSAQSLDGGFVEGFAMNTVAVIKRSNDHPFYHLARMARFPSYGVGRTDLINAQEVAQRLSDQGIAAQVVEFGSMTLGQQIQVAGRARAFIGIRGAEFANVIWMRPNTHAIMLATPARENHATRTLSRVKKVRFESVAVSATKIWLDCVSQQTIAKLLCQAPANMT
jgi:hypothetical protein